VRRAVVKISALPNKYKQTLKYFFFFLEQCPYHEGFGRLLLNVVYGAYQFSLLFTICEDL
jgi:hypothetical protein